jgi:hypothetical protein
MALLLIVLLYATGRLMDGIWGPQVIVHHVTGESEFDVFVQKSTADFHKWYDFRAPAVEAKHRQGIFQTALHEKVQLFDQLVRSAVQLDVGFDQLMPGVPPAGNSVLGVLRIMLLMPVWLWHVHPWFLVLWLVVTLLLWSLFGGAISRMTIVDAAKGRVIGPTEAFAFAFHRWGWYLLAPVMPLIVVAVLGGLLALYGLLFNVPVLDIVASLVFIGALGAGFLIALLVIGWLAGVHLMYPALSAEGTDAFDAVSRGFSYVLARPWRLVGYGFVAIVYGAITYLFVGVIIFLIIVATRSAVSSWVFVDAQPPANVSTMSPGDELEKFDALFPPPVFGQLEYQPNWDRLGATGDITATVMMIWIYLLIGVLGAYAISFYFSSFSVIYLLLRRYTDGTDLSQVYEAQAPAPPLAAEKIEPAPAPATAAPAAPPSEGQGPAGDSSNV